MARPTKQGIDYFPVDVQFDEKVELLIAEKGANALSVLITVWQLIYQNHGYYIDAGEDLYLLVRRRILLEVDVIKDIIKKAIERNIFDKNLFEKYNILTSAGIQKRYITAARHKKEIVFIKEYLLIDVSSVGNVIYKQVSNVGNATNEKKLNKIKRDEIKRNEIREKGGDSKGGEKQHKNSFALNDSNHSEPPSKKPQIDFDWSSYSFKNITENDIKLWQKAYPAIDIEQEINKAASWLAANPKNKKKNYRRFLTNWFSRAQDRAPPRKLTREEQIDLVFERFEKMHKGEKDDDTS